MPTITDENEQLRLGRRRVGLLSGALAALSLPGLLWLAGRPGDFDAGIIVMVGLLFIASEIFTVDVEFRHESQILTFTSIPLVVGLMILPPVIVIALRLFTMVLLYATVQRQPSYKLVFNAASALLDAVIVALLITLVSSGDFGPGKWIIVFAAVVAGDTFSGFTTTAAISCFQGHWEPTSVSDLWLASAGAVADVAIAVVVVTLVEDGEPAAVLVLALGAFFVVLARAYSKVRARYQSLQLLDRFTRAAGESVTDGSLVVRLLSESADILHADRAWLISSSDVGDYRRELNRDSIDMMAADDFDHAVLARLGDAAELITDTGPMAAEMTAAGLTEVIAVRLPSTQDRVHALVIADRSGEVRPFDDEDVALFQTLSVHAGLALQNLGLVEQLRTEILTTEHTATHDALTSLPNRIRFQQQLDSAIADGGNVAVLLLDLNRFKEVNDTLGHHNGDVLLVEVGRRLTSIAGAGEVVARLGGDEFAILLTSCADEATAFAAADRVAAELHRPFEIQDVALDLDASVGIAHNVTVAADGPTLMRQADVAMYLAKDARTTAEVYSPDRDHYSAQRLALVGRLRVAIAERALALHYQPQIDLRTGAVLGVEALIRWPQPGKHPIPPDEFIYIAEHTGLIHPLTQFVLEEAIAQASRWFHGGTPLRVSLNLSAYNLVDPGLIDEIARLLALGDLPPSMLMIELTESAVMANPTRSVEIMRALRDIGCSIAIDDFGTGHSSLSYLTGVPATELKIDQSFVFAMGTDPAADTIVRTIIDLGRNLGLELVAEGVETVGQADTLAQMGCDIVQGYFYSRPLEVRGLELWLEGRQLAADTPHTTDTVGADLKD